MKVPYESTIVASHFPPHALYYAACPQVCPEAVELVVSRRGFTDVYLVVLEAKGAPFLAKMILGGSKGANVGYRGSLHIKSSSPKSSS